MRRGEARGAALPMVLFAMTMTSALAVGGVFVARQLAASARFEHRGASLQPAAERALVDVIVGWDSSARAQQTIGSAAVLLIQERSGPPVHAWVTRINERTYWLVAEATSPDRPALRRRIGALVRETGGVPALVPRGAWSELP